MNTIIELQDNGQDFLEMIVDEQGFVIETRPFQTHAWKGAYIPLEDIEVGEHLMIHNPPNIEWGYLKHRVKSIKNEINEETEINQKHDMPV